MITAVIDGRPYRFDEASYLAHGGEADVHRFKPDSRFTARFGNGPFVVKLFPEPEEDNDDQRRAVIERHFKLNEFPSGLPADVVQPVTLAYHPTQRIQGAPKVIGYVMYFMWDTVPLVEFKSPQFQERYPERVKPHRLCRILVNLHKLVVSIHACGVVIGDFNDKNILVGPNDEVYLLDADSLQFGRWECPALVPEFTDPLIIEVQKDPRQIKKIGKHSVLTDWYSFAVIAFQLLVRIHPYLGGFYRPGQGEKPVKGNRRIQQQISVFHPQVTMPETATPLDTLPEGLDRVFRLIFVNNQRGQFPRGVLTSVRWSQCITCGTEHGRKACPRCSGPITNPATARRPSMRTQVRVAGRIVSATSQGGRLQCVYYEDGAYRRENREPFWTGAFDPNLSVLIAGDRTVTASGDSFTIFGGTRSTSVRTQQAYGKTTVTANSQNVYWVDGNSLVHDDAGRGKVVIGTVAAGLTSVWAGEAFGLAMVQAGTLTRVLTFDANRPGLTGLTLPPTLGTVVDAHCAISDDLAWLVLSIRAASGRIVNRCYVFNSRAQLQATGEANRGGSTWLGHMSRAVHATDTQILVPVPRAGIVRIEVRGGTPQGTIIQDSAKLVPDRVTTVKVAQTTHGIQHISTNTITPVS